MNTDIITNPDYEINTLNNKDEELTTSDELLDEGLPNVLEVVSKNFNGKQLIID